jgi:hypothetical protein
LELEKVVSMFNAKNVINVSVGFACLPALMATHGNVEDIMIIAAR